MDRYEIGFDFAVEVARQSYVKLIWRTHGPYIASSIIILLLCLRALPDSYYRPLGSFGLGIIVVFWYGWLEHYRLAGSTRSRKSDNSVKVILEDEFFRFESTEAIYIFRWKAFSRLYKLKGFLIPVIATGNIYFPIPFSAVSAAAGAFLESKIAQVN